MGVSHFDLEANNWFLRCYKNHKWQKRMGLPQNPKHLCFKGNHQESGRRVERCLRDLKNWVFFQRTQNQYPEPMSSIEVVVGVALKVKSSDSSSRNINDAITLENSVATQKIVKLGLHMIQKFYSYMYTQKNWKYIFKKFVYVNIQCSSGHNSSNIETTQCLLSSKCINENVIYTCTKEMR